MVHLAARDLPERKDSVRLVCVCGCNTMARKWDLGHRASDLCASQEKSLRPSGVVSVLPFEGHARIAKDELHQIGEACLRANIV